MKATREPFRQSSDAIGHAPDFGMLVPYVLADLVVAYGGLVSLQGTRRGFAHVV